MNLTTLTLLGLALTAGAANLRKTDTPTPSRTAAGDHSPNALLEARGEARGEARALLGVRTLQRTKWGFVKKSIGFGLTLKKVTDASTTPASDTTKPSSEDKDEDARLAEAPLSMDDAAKRALAAAFTKVSSHSVESGMCGMKQHACYSSYAKAESKFVKWGQCVQTVITCKEGYEKCAANAEEDCKGDTACKAYAVKKLGGNDYLKYTTEECVSKNTYGDRYWDLYTEAGNSDLSYRECQAVAFAACEKVPNCVATTVRKLGGNDYQTYTPADKTCVTRNTKDETGCDTLEVKEKTGHLIGYSGEVKTSGWPAKASSALACADLCKATAECTAFHYYSFLSGKPSDACYMWKHGTTGNADPSQTTTSVTKDTCLAAAVKEFGDKVTAKRTMQTGSWHWVPSGCSVQSGGDFAAHWNTAGGKNDGSYTGVHVSNFIRWTGSCILSQWDLYTKNPVDDEATKVAKRRKACIEKRMEKEAAAKKAAAEKAKTDAGGGDATNPDDTESDDTNTVSNLKKKKKKKTWASVLLPSDGGPDDPVCGDEAAEWGDKDPSKKGQVRVAAG